MEFPYAKVIDFPKHQKRARLLPWIRVGIFNPREPSIVVYTVGLVDSGADVSIIDREVGEELGYEIEKGGKEQIVGLGGGVTQGFVHEVGFKLENPSDPKDIIKYTDLAVFTKNTFPNTTPQQTAIYGTIGFFRHLMVTFIYPQQIIIETLAS